MKPRVTHSGRDCQRHREKPGWHYVRDLVEYAEAEGTSVADLTTQVIALTGGHPDKETCYAVQDALTYTRVANQLRRGELDIATYLDEPFSASLDLLREQEIDRCESLAEAACRKLGEKA